MAAIGEQFEGSLAEVGPFWSTLLSIWYYTVYSVVITFIFINKEYLLVILKTIIPTFQGDDICGLSVSPRDRDDIIQVSGP